MTAKTIPSYVEVHNQRCGYIGCSRGNNLDEVYSSYSAAKARAWKQCESLCAEFDGFNLCITSYNTSVFTAQFEFDNPDNGRPMVCHITPSDTYAMYLDMRHIDTAREAWTHYVELYSPVRYTSEEWASHDGQSRVVWVGGYAYIVACDEVYRVLDPYKRAGGLRKRIELQRVGAVEDAVVDGCLQHASGVICDGAIPCWVAVGGEHATPFVYAQSLSVDIDDIDTLVWDVVCASHVELSACIAMCVDACMMMHGSDAQGATVRLMNQEAVYDIMR